MISGIPDSTGTVAVNILVGTGPIVICSKRIPRDGETYLVGFGNSIGLAGSNGHVTFQIRQNGSPLPPFDNMSSQWAPAEQLAKFDPGYILAPGALIECVGTLDATAPGTTEFAAGLDFITYPKRS